jgi:TatD family-associated radical SAM protein
MDEKPKVVYWLNNNLYLNITNRCSNKCWFCFRNFKQGVGGFNLKLREEPTPADVINKLQAALSSKHWKEVVFCGFGEPTARLDVLLEVAQWVRDHVSTVNIRVNTNGHGYALNKGRDVAKELKIAGVDKVSVSLNGWDEETYGVNCRPEFVGAFEAVKAFVNKAVEAGLQVEISAVRMPEVDTKKIEEIAKAMNVPLRIREYVPCFW